MTKYFVSRQCYWPEGTNMVEVSIGSCDYSGSDMLSPKFPGEAQEYSDPQEAVEVAINILSAWKKLYPNKEIFIGYGNTMGMGLQFDPSSIEEIKAWADKQYAKLPKCDRCHELLKDGSTYQFADGFSPDEKYCSEYCLEKAAELFAEEEDV